MSAITTSTQIDTINILSNTTSTFGTDLFLVQRGATTYNLLKSDFKLPINQLEEIDSWTIVGNATGASAVPQEIDTLRDLDVSIPDDTSIASAKAIKTYVDNSTQIVTWSGSGSGASSSTGSAAGVIHGGTTRPDLFFAYQGDQAINSKNRANGTDGGRYFANVAASDTKIWVNSPGWDIGGTVNYSAIWFSGYVSA